MSPQPAAGGTARPIASLAGGAQVWPPARRGELPEAWECAPASGFTRVPAPRRGPRCSAVPRDLPRSCKRTKSVRVTLHSW